MIYKIKMSKDDFFKINKKIISSNLEIDGDEVYFEVEGGSYQILKRSNYKYKVIESIQNKIIRFVNQYLLVIVGVLFLFSILYINTYRVKKIEFNRQTPINDEIEYRITSSYKKLFFFDFCNLDYQTFSQKLRTTYPEYPYIEVGFEHNIINVTIHNYDEVTYQTDSVECGDIIAKKDGIVDVFYIYNGKNMVYKNQYVKAGDVLISGMIVDKNVTASGLIMATTYEKVILEIPKTEYVSIETTENETYYQLQLFNWKLDLGKDNTFTNYNRLETVEFNLFDFFTVKKIEDIRKNDIIVTYSYDEALKAASDKINSDFELRMVNSLEKIIDLAEVKCVENDDSYLFTFIVKKYESIGTFQSY